MKYKSFLLLAVAIFFGGAESASAAQVTYLTDDTALITIDVQFDAFADLSIPAFTDHILRNTKRDEIGFVITDSTGNTPHIEQLTSVMLSSQPLSGTKYQVQSGTIGQLTLVALVTFSKPATDITANITHLPYWIDGRRTSVHQNQLDEIGVNTN